MQAMWCHKCCVFAFLNFCYLRTYPTGTAFPTSCKHVSSARMYVSLTSTCLGFRRHTCCPMPFLFEARSCHRVCEAQPSPEARHRDCEAQRAPEARHAAEAPRPEAAGGPSPAGGRSREGKTSLAVAGAPPGAEAPRRRFGVAAHWRPIAVARPLGNARAPASAPKGGAASPDAAYNAAPARGPHRPRISGSGMARQAAGPARAGDEAIALPSCGEEDRQAPPGHAAAGCGGAGGARRGGAAGCDRDAPAAWRHCALGAGCGKGVGGIELPWRPGWRRVIGGSIQLGCAASRWRAAEVL